MSKRVLVRYVCEECASSVYYIPRMFAHQTRFWPTNELKKCQASCGKYTIHYREVEQA